mmetsp:Transcript_10948/g.16432  ORF Transcript_10948/g.16432 Transcript_10948/m.16432 type:complete len:404 (-) Transcript_10948:87-1298(-)|eukprot:CAMPEP_0196814766 /NCGR_PEP_ID=MMETSP1362-20130617/45649_1 /TAXON_ID=163516 /ORGANISM="Leptocylindrus danicus, Strain CCMP1856" /LENGTH=403 /DNA_ID=CAMNT_0042191493 /DNA_START=82 /DNA_END=1293 /DNA_ORIENTATION=-
MRINGLLFFQCFLFQKASSFVAHKQHFGRRESIIVAAQQGSSVQQEIFDTIKLEASSLQNSLNTALKYTQSSTIAKDVAVVCDELDKLCETKNVQGGLLMEKLGVHEKALRFARRNMLTKLMREDYEAYVATAEFLSPGRIPRSELPNVQDVSITNGDDRQVTRLLDQDTGLDLVADCELEDMKFNDSLLDKLLLKIFRELVVKESDGIAVSDKAGIDGLLEQGRKYMLKPNQTAEAQHQMVYNVLKGLMTPVLPPFYRLFMSGIVPKFGSDLDGKQFGPWFYAPWLTSFVTPTFFGFLVGPSRPNYKKDGQLGGLVVEKCKFLQESGCKGLCLNQCKLPAQQFFAEELGLPLTVSPNFVTQECQWSFGEVPLTPEDDPSFPRGCLAGCESRKAMVGSYADNI